VGAPRQCAGFRAWTAAVMDGWRPGPRGRFPRILPRAIVRGIARPECRLTSPGAMGGGTRSVRQCAGAPSWRERESCARLPYGVARTGDVPRNDDARHRREAGFRVLGVQLVGARVKPTRSAKNTMMTLRLGRPPRASPGGLRSGPTPNRAATLSGVARIRRSFVPPAPCAAAAGLRPTAPVARDRPLSTRAAPAPSESAAAPFRAPRPR